MYLFIIRNLAVHSPLVFVCKPFASYNVKCNVNHMCNRALQTPWSRQPSTYRFTHIPALTTSPMNKTICLDHILYVPAVRCTYTYALHICKGICDVFYDIFLHFTCCIMLTIFECFRSSCGSLCAKYVIDQDKLWYRWMALHARMARYITDEATATLLYT